MMSGGLDSSLAVRTIHDMGIDLIGVHFTGPFCLCNRGARGCIHFARKQAEDLHIPFQTLPLGEEYLEIVAHPKHGYGSGMNPCLDCRILMLRRAKAMMAELGASFIVTGEVLGQRPMSQLRHKLAIIEKESGLEGLILRPRSAQHLSPTVPEQEGWVDRAKLLGISGRSRRTQIDLAEALKIGDYPCPAGGCLLTDAHFADRLRDHLKHGPLHASDIPLLKVGRHFRLSDKIKLVIGRDQEENASIEALATDRDVLITPETVSGPSGLVRGPAPDPQTLLLAVGILADYCNGTGPVQVRCKHAEPGDAGELVQAERHPGDALKI